MTINSNHRNKTTLYFSEVAQKRIILSFSIQHRVIRGNRCKTFKTPVVQYNCRNSIFLLILLITQQSPLKNTKFPAHPEKTFHFATKQNINYTMIGAINTSDTPNKTKSKVLLITTIYLSTKIQIRLMHVK